MSATAAAQAQVAAQAQKAKEGAVAAKPVKSTTLALTDGKDASLLTKKYGPGKGDSFLAKSSDFLSWLGLCFSCFSCYSLLLLRFREFHFSLL